MQKKDGFHLVGVKGDVQLGGVTFARVEFQQALAYEVVLVKTCDAYAFVFFFGASDLESANKLIGQTTVKFEAKNPGCGAATSTTPQKK